MLPNNQTDWSRIERGQDRGRRGGVAGLVIGFLLFGALIGFAADRWVVSNLNVPRAASAPTAVASGPRIGPVAAADGAPTATTDPTQQAIQQVIRRGDEEQAQALAANDPSVMADTSTSDFLQQQVQVNQ